MCFPEHRSASSGKHLEPAMLIHRVESRFIRRSLGKSAAKAASNCTPSSPRTAHAIPPGGRRRSTFCAVRARCGPPVALPPHGPQRPTRRNRHAHHRHLHLAAMSRQSKVLQGRGALSREAAPFSKAHVFFPMGRFSELRTSPPGWRSRGAVRRSAARWPGGFGLEGESAHANRRFACSRSVSRSVTAPANRSAATM